MAEPKYLNAIQYAEIPWEEPFPRSAASIPNPLSIIDNLPDHNEKPKTVLGFIHNTWTLELLGVIISTVAVLIMFIVLKLFAGGPLPSLPSGVTLNVFIAGMTIVLSMGINVPLSNGLSQLKWTHLYFKKETRHLDSIESMDAASRGPWGSFLLLCFSPQGWISAMGASALLLSLLASLSTQLILQYPTTTLNSSEPANLSYCKSYLSYDAGLDVPAFPVTSLTQAFNNGLYSSPTTDLTLSIPVICPTGNCTWPTITTLAVCSECTNLTTQIIDRSDPTYHEPLNYQVGDRNIWITDNAHTTYFNSSELRASHFFDLVHYSFMGKRSESPPQPWALECVLYLCSQTITTTTNNQKTSQEVVSSWRNETEAQIPYGGDLVYPPSNITFQTSIDLAVDTSSWQAVKTFFANGAFDGSVYYSSYGDLDYSGTTAMRSFYAAATNGIDNTIGGPPGMMGGNIPLLFGQIATSMTNAMRSDNTGITMNSSDGTSYAVIVAGQAHTMVRLVHVRWEWLAPPVLVLMLTWIFLGAVIWKNRRAKAVMWKSHALAMLAIDGGVRHGLRGCKNVESLTKRAKIMEVNMERSGDDDVLREANSGGYRHV